MYSNLFLYLAIMFRTNRKVNKMKKVKSTFILAFAAVFFILLAKPAYSANKLTPMSEISIITCSPGYELYSVFGHSAIRVSDPGAGIDFVYNYGTFDFGDPDFYMKFTRGKLDYMLSVEPFPLFREAYIYENRSVWEQVLDLTQKEKQTVFDMLQENAKPENKYYKYDFFYDNCSSRIRDIIRKALNNGITFPNLKREENYSFRNLIDEYLGDFRWSDFGIDMSLGLPTDKVASSEQYMFLPYELKKGFDSTVFKGTTRPLVKKLNVIFEAKKTEAAKSLFQPVNVFWGIFILMAIVSAMIWKRKPNRYWIDFTIFLIFGLLGVFLLLLWLATDHKATAWNMNILWALPTHIVMAFLLLKKTKPFFVDMYFLCNGLLMLLILLAFVPLPQQLNISVIPIILLLGMRSFIIFFKEKRKDAELQISNNSEDIGSNNNS